MSNYATLIASIQSVITQNGNNEITGTILQQTLLSIINSLGVGYQFVGVATPETNPGTPDQRVYYIASSGTYPNFGPATIPAGNLAVLYYDTSWHYSLCEITAKFASGEEVKETYIDDTHLANPKDGALPTADDVLQLKAKLEGVTASEVKVNAVVGTNVTTGKYVSGETGLLVTPSSSASRYAYFELAIPQGTKSIRFATGTKTSASKIGYSFGHYEGNVYVPTRMFYFDVAGTTPPTGIVEKVIEILEGETTFRTTVASVSTYSSITLDKFYCYLQSGKSVIDEIQQIESNIDNIELFMQDYEQYEEVDMNKVEYKNSNNNISYDGTITPNSGWTYIKIPVSGYSKVSFLALIRTADEPQGYCFQKENGDFFGGQKYKYASTSGTEEITLDIPEGAIWFYTNSRFATNTYFTNNFFIKLINGDTLKTIIDEAKQAANEYTDSKIADVEGEIDDIRDVIEITEKIEGLTYEFGSFVWSNVYGWIRTKSTNSSTKRLRIVKESGDRFLTLSANTVIKAPENCTLMYCIYGLGESFKIRKSFTALPSGNTLTIENDCNVFVYFTSNNDFWEGEYNNAEITDFGLDCYNDFIDGSYVDFGTIDDKINFVEETLQKEIDSIKKDSDSLVIEPTIERTNAIDYHAALDYLCYDLDPNSENPKHPLLLRSEPTYLKIDETGADTNTPNNNYPLYTYTLNAQLMYMLVDAHMDGDNYIDSSGNGYQVYAPKTGNASTAILKPYDYYKDENNVFAGNYRVNGVNNGIFYNNNWIKSGKKKILIVSGIHGDEYGAPLGLYEFIKNLFINPNYADLLVNCEFTFIPIANPWGYDHNSRLRGTYDINRDFDDYNGFVTQEAQYIKNVLNETRFDMVFDLHQHGNTIDVSKNGLHGGFTSFNCGEFETPAQVSGTNTFVDANTMNNQYTFTPIGRKIANAINEIGVMTDIAACTFAEIDYLQHSFVWINPIIGGVTLKTYAAGESRYAANNGTITDVLVGNKHAADSGQTAYLTMTCETPMVCSWMNDGNHVNHNINSRRYTNTYINNLLTIMCRKLVNGDFGESNS